MSDIPMSVQNEFIDIFQDPESAGGTGKGNEVTWSGIASRYVSDTSVDVLTEGKVITGIRILNGGPIYPGQTVWGIKDGNIRLILGAFAVPASQKIAELVVPVAGSTYSIGFDKIPATFKSLEVRWSALFLGSDTTESLRMHMNGDAGTNYEHTEIYALSSVGGGRPAAESSAAIGEASDAGGYWAQGIIRIDGYNNTATRTGWQADTTGVYSGQGAVQTHEYGWWNNGATVYWLKFFGVRGFAFAPGSRFSIYGYN